MLALGQFVGTRWVVKRCLLWGSLQGRGGWLKDACSGPVRRDEVGS